MKRRIIKGTVAAVTALLILIVPLLTVAASAKTEICPRVWVHGFMATTVYEDADDPDSLPAWPPTSDEILGAVKSSVPALAELALTKNWDRFGEEMGDIAADVFARAMNNPDGTVKDGSGVHFEYPPEDEITADSDIYFKYDWRKDSIEIAAELNDFIDYVLEASDCDQVALTCHSFGGVVAITYFTLYGCEKVKTVVFNSTAIYGETYTGDLMTGKLYFSGDSLTNYLYYAFKGTEYEYLLNAVIKIFNDSGILDAVTEWVNSITPRVQKEVCARSIVPLFGGWLAIWSMVPDEYLEEATDYVFNTIYGDSETDYSALRAKIENYNELVRCKKTETLKKVNEECNVYVIARYGYSSIPITPSADKQGDGIVDVKYASFGATAADFGTTLENITSDAKYISPDKTVDASTCLFPEQTWFVKNLKHGEATDTIDVMMRKFMRYDGQGTVETFEDYPRYTIFDGETISPDEYDQNNSTLFDNLRLIINDILKLVKVIFDKIRQN